MLFALLFSCQEDSQTTETVARVGEEQITFDDFIYNFTLFPQYQPNSTLRDARLQHLDHMADRIILYLAAEKENLDQSEEIQQRIEYIRHKEVLKYLYQQEVLSKIPVSDEIFLPEHWKKRRNIPGGCKMGKVLRKLPGKPSWTPHWQITGGTWDSFPLTI
jgi:hypothetical protein